MRSSSKEQLKAWKKEMGYEQVKQAMMTDSMLDRVCSPVRVEIGDDG